MSFFVLSYQCVQEKFPYTCTYVLILVKKNKNMKTKYFFYNKPNGTGGIAYDYENNKFLTDKVKFTEQNYHYTTIYGKLKNRYTI